MNLFVLVVMTVGLIPFHFSSSPEKKNHTKMTITLIYSIVFVFEREQAEAKGPFYLKKILSLSNVSVAVDIKVYSVPSAGGINLVEVGRSVL